MSFLVWMGLIGALLLLMAVSSAYLRRLPITTAAIYLALDLLVSPFGLGLIDVNFIEWRVWFYERAISSDFDANHSPR